MAADSCEVESYDFPVQAGFQAASGGGVDAFVAKVDPTGSRLIYRTYLGGNSEDRALAIAVDSAGNAYVAGWTASTNFPVTASIMQNRNAGQRDACVAKISSGRHGE